MIYFEVDHEYPSLPLDVVQDLYSSDATQELCPVLL